MRSPVKPHLVKLGVVTLCALTSALASIARGAPETPQQQAQVSVLTRQGLFKVQSFAWGPVANLLRGAPFDTAAIQKAAVRVQFTAGMIPALFAKDTHTFSIPTRAREGIWTNKEDFDNKAGDLVKASADLEAAAKTGDKDATMKAARTVGKACSACHDEFRNNPP